ncbi:autotransporter outer membrane beta-barrel domain-containing protein [Franconibacter sp. IITDAS19]|uniref:autotransporter family protein n=1 Tax=Franconibacter sp. IITDAS19 TaxID=2930569 RepID=UPI001FFB04BE|nr:autotransporter outer membrane beta-barrel domain-containing protein [Franconibacter sp. IITDAS19]MCK1970351.1 autotransporter outer membrane beta-barrel domain-containing protein [Franconibacter sp. IITDAS19]
MKKNFKVNALTESLCVKFPILLAGLFSVSAMASQTVIDSNTNQTSTVTISDTTSSLIITEDGVLTDNTNNCMYDVDASWSFTNNGTFKSSEASGHSLHIRRSGDYDIVNTGTIEITGGKTFLDATAASQNFNISNSGTITSKSATLFEIGTSGSTTLNFDNTATGKISSETGTVLDYSNSSGVVAIDNLGEISSGNTAIKSQGKTTIHNAGKISGTDAIVLGSQNDELQLETTSQITGNVKAGGGTDKLTLQGDTGEGSINLSQYTGFETFNKNGKGTWELTGTNASGETSDWNLNAGTLKVAKDAVVKGSVLVSKDVTENTTLEMNGKIDNGDDAAIDFESNTDNQLIYNTGASLGKGGVKVGAGNVYLTGTGAIDQAVNIDKGTLYIGDGQEGTGGAIASDVTNNGTLVFDRADNYTYDNVISGTGAVEKQGAGNVILTKDQTYTGDTTIKSGAMILTNDIELQSANVTVDSNATLGGYGSLAGNVINNGLIAVADAAPGYENDQSSNFIIGGDLTNNGELRLGSANPGSTLTVQGNYTGNNGLLTMDMVLNDDTTSSGDLMVVEGDTAGTTYVTVNNAGGMGGQTIEGIKVIDVNGQSNGDFIQQGRIVAGAYDYYLTKGTTSNPEDGSWYLRSETEPAPTPAPEPAPTPAPEPVPVRPEAGAYMGNQAAAKSMFMSTMHDRMGEQNFMQAQSSDDVMPSTWVRTSGSRTKSKTAGNIDNSTDSTMFQLGNDITAWSANGSDRGHLGFMFGYGYAKTDSYSAKSKAGSRNATGKVKGYNAGLYGTWYADAKEMKGLYLDSSLQYSWFDNETKGEQLASEKYNSDLLQASMEAGYTMLALQKAEKSLYVEPQAQVIYSSMNTDDFHEANGTRIHDADASGYTTRLGMRVFGRVLNNNTAIEPFVEANWWHDTAENSIKMNEDKLNDKTPANRYEVKGGVEGKISDNFHSWVNVGYQTGGNDFSEVTGMAGVKYVW